MKNAVLDINYPGDHQSKLNRAITSKSIIMATLETTLKENGTRTLRKHFLNVKFTARGSWHERRRFGY